jgi:hypothetical protein
MDLPSELESLLGSTLAAALAAGMGWLARGLGVRNAWLAAGVLAGVILGPQGLGRVDPVLQGRLFLGAEQARRDAFTAARTIEVARMAAVANAASVDAQELVAFEAARLASEDRVRAERIRFDTPAAWLAAMLAAATMMFASPLIGRISWWTHGGPAIGLWSVAAPVVVTVLVLVAHSDGPASLWWLPALAVVAIGAPSPRAADRWIAVRLLGPHAPAIDTARAMAGVLALVTVLVASGVQQDRDARGLAWLLPWGVTLAAWARQDQPWSWRLPLTRMLAAAVAAMALARVDPMEAWQGWVVLVVFVAIEDMRWLGASLGLSLWSRVPFNGCLRACMPMADAGAAQLALGGTAMLTGVIPAWMGLAILLSGAAMELLEPLRRGTAMRLDQSLQQS